MKKKTKIGIVHPEFNTVTLGSILIKDDAGEWGNEADSQMSIPVIRSTNFRNNGILNLSNVAYRSVRQEKYEEKLLSSGDILIERSGGSDSQPVGRVGFIDASIEQMKPIFANFIQRISLQSEANSKFIFYCLQQMYEMRITYTMQYQTTGIRNLDWRLFKKIKLPLPSFPEQKIIAAILSKVDEAIAAVEDSIKAAEKVKKALMQNLLTGKLKPDGTWRSEDEFYTDEKFGKIPKGWKYNKLKELIIKTPDYGANASAVNFMEGMPRFIRITDIDDFGYLIPHNKVGIFEDVASKYILDDNDFLFARTGDTVGKSLLYKKEMGYAAFAGYLIRIKINFQKLFPEYLKIVALSDFFEAFKISVQKVGAKPNINAREYSSFKFILPETISEQEEIYACFEKLLKIIEQKHQKIESLKKLKKSLMQNLLTGKIRINPSQFQHEISSSN